MANSPISGDAAPVIIPDPQVHPAVDIDGAKWGAAWMRLKLAEMRSDMEIAALDACDKDDPRRAMLEELVEDSTDRFSDAEDVLIKMPAPDKAAVSWKVNKLWSDPTVCWSVDYLAQTVADIQRFLGDA